MNIKKWLAAAGVVSLLVPGAGAEPQKPNFVVIFTDDLEFANLGYYRNKALAKSRWLQPGSTPPVHTPYLDRLFNDGVVFSQAYVPSPVCTPSRYCLLTGQYASRSAEFDRTEQANIGWSPWLRKGEPTFPNVLREHGYTTGLAGKWMVSGGHALRPHKLDPAADPHDPEVNRRLRENYASAVKEVKARGGFDEVESLYASNVNFVRLRALDAHNQEWVTQGALNFIERNKDNPFMLYLATTTPHGPNPLGSLDADPRITPLGFLEEAPMVQPSRESVKERALAGWTPEMARKASRTHPEWAMGNAAASTWIDDSVGAVLNRLEELGLSKNTVVIFTSDHQWRGKLALYQSAHVPFVVYWPSGIQSGVECNRLVSTLDIAPTLFDMAGIEPPENMTLDGYSLLPLLHGEKPTVWRDSLFLEITTTRAVVGHDGFKYIAWRLPPELLAQQEAGKVLSQLGHWVDDPAFKSWNPADRPPRYHVARDFPAYYETDQLYDLNRDPDEQNNLARNPEYATVMEKMKQRLEEYSGDLPTPFGEFKPRK